MGNTQTWLADMTHEECLARLASTPLGRLGVVVGARPEIFPVNHVLDPETGNVMFPSNSRTKLAAALEWPWVAFEVDGIDADGGYGWSVMVVGHAELVEDPFVISRAVELRYVVWAIGPHSHWVQIVPSKITGRRISAVES
jgi:nitroimidazol reductase NimA-like FMN-containing flavoprotein (pyridoxamine 5'-phosphate oxidase superfamily)